MSRSPETADRGNDRDLVDPYRESWDAIHNLIDEGMSWSGHERNCTFLNLAGARFADVSAISGLDFDDDGRAVAVVDWDFDGRLDLWTTNRTAPRARLLRNTGDAAGRFVAFRLEGTTANRDAVGARVELVTDDGRPRIRTVHAGSGYLAQSTRWVHFGLGPAGNCRIERLVVRWPGGAEETFEGVEAGRFHRVVEGTGRAEPWEPPGERPVELAESPVEIPSRSDASRTWVVGRVPVPAESFASATGESQPLAAFRGRPLLVNLWSATCAPCLAELGEWSRRHDELERAGLRVLALSVDPDPVPPPEPLPFATGTATPECVGAFETVHRALIETRKPLPVPTSILLDADGLVAALYKGPVSCDELLADLALLPAPLEAQREAALPFPGRWRTPPLPPLPRQVIGTLMQAGDTEGAGAYARRCLAPDSGLDLAPSVRASITLFLGDLDLDAGRLDASVASYARLFDLAPDDADLHREVALRLVTKQRPADAIPHLERVVALDPAQVDARLNLAVLAMREGDLPVATTHFETLAAQRPDVAQIQFQLANLLHLQGRDREAVDRFRTVHRLQPESPAANNLAWILATHPDPSIRDGTEALALAEEACRARDFADPVLLNTLAAAQAETGRFVLAVATAEKALALADADPSSAGAALAGRIRAHLEAYRAGHPIREPSRTEESTGDTAPRDP